VTRFAVRWLLRLATPALRLRHGGEMEALVHDALAEARRRGVAAVAMVWTHVTTDLLASRVRAWRRPRRRPFAPYAHERQASMLGSDIRYALRALARQKGASLLVLAMLSLGIAANVAVFSLVNGLFLKPFPFPNPDRLVAINEMAPKWNLEYVGVNYPDFVQWRRDQRAFEAIAWADTTSFNLAGATGSERIAGAQVTFEYARVLGLQPLIGRMFTEEETAPTPRTWS
jgi:hypothetical protein